MTFVRALALAFLLLAVAGSAAASGTTGSTLRVTQVRAAGSPLPVEGAIPYIRVSRENGTTVVRRRLNLTRKLPFAAVPLAPGRYRLQSWQRDCDGNCSRLGPPTDRCGGWFRIRRGQTLRARVTVTYGSGCRIAFA
jgi:hypothetical protein